MLSIGGLESMMNWLFQMILGIVKTTRVIRMNEEGFGGGEMIDGWSGGG
jgi:hypothetical protein